MQDHHRLVSLAVVVLAAALAVGGCKKNTPPPASSQQPAQPQTATTQAQADQAAQATQPTGQPAPSAQQVEPAPAAPQAAPAAAPATPPPPPQPTVVTLPAGTLISVRLDQDLGSKISQTGQTFRATVARNVVISGQTLIPIHARAEGVVTDAEPLGKIKGGARLALTLQRVHTPWGSYPVATSSVVRAEQGKGKRTAVMGGGGAGLGAILGGIAGGGKGALIGGLVGGGAGTAGSAFTGNKQIVLPTETLLTFRLQKSVQITTQP
jgi:hypothetical protein